MAIIKGWSFGKENGFTGSAKSDVQHFAKGGKVEGKSTTPPARPQKHFDRMENFRKERDTQPASPDKEEAKMKKGGKAKKYAEGGSVSKNLAADSKLNRPGGEGTKNVVGFKKGGKTRSKSGGGKGATAQKAAGALAQIAAMAQNQGPQPGLGVPPGAGAMPPGMPPGAGATPGMKRGGSAKKKK